MVPQGSKQLYLKAWFTQIEKKATYFLTYPKWYVGIRMIYLPRLWDNTEIPASTPVQ